MEGPLALVAGVLFGAGVYAMGRRNMVRFVFGLILLTSAVNMLIFTVGGLVPSNPPLVPAQAQTPTAPFAPPLPQAMILTAIVIGFGLVAFTLVLIYRAYLETGELDPDAMQSALPRSGEYADPLPDAEQ